MAALLRLRNTSDIPQIIYLRDGPVRVVPRGTVLVPPGHCATRSRSFVRVGESPTAPAPPAPGVDALLAEIESLKRQLAEQARSGEVREAPAEQSYPQHQGGGKWLLSDGTLTAGKINRETAEELEADLHARE